MSGSEREEEGAVEEKPLFEVQKSTLHSFRDVQGYQQTTAAKLAANTLIVERATHYWWSVVTLCAPLGHTDYGGHLRISGNHLWWTTALTNTQ